MIFVLKYNLEVEGLNGNPDKRESQFAKWIQRATASQPIPTGDNFHSEEAAPNVTVTEIRDVTTDGDFENNEEGIISVEYTARIEFDDPTIHTRRMKAKLANWIRQISRKEPFFVDHTAYQSHNIDITESWEVTCV